MTTIYLVTGVVLLAFAALDALWTTLWVNGGGGPLSGRLTSVLWRGLRRATPEGRAWPIGVSGPVVVVAVVLAWVALLWAGWVLVFASGTEALAYSDTGDPVGWTGRLYFVGYTLFTLGIGNVVPARGPWELATVVASGSGMLFITLAISYVLSVLSSVVGVRAFAGSVGGLGADAEQIVARAWDGERYAGITLPLNALGSQLDLLTQQHLAYPVLHYYHATDPGASAALAVAVFDEALTLLRFGVPEAHRPPASVLESARASVASYVDTLQGAFIEEGDREPRAPNLGRLRAAGLPTVSDAAFETALTRHAARRRALLGMVEADARAWPPEQP